MAACISSSRRKNISFSVAVSFVLVCVLIIERSQGLTASDGSVLITILSQKNSYNIDKVKALLSNITSDVTRLGIETPNILLSHRDLADIHAWALFPLVQVFSRYPSVKWFFVCNEDTHMNIGKLYDIINSKNSDEHWFIGHRLRDKTATIIHHFAFHDNPSKFSYPDLTSGFFLSNSLVKVLSSRLKTENMPNFSIDPKHEFAKFIWDEGQGITLSHDNRLCLIKDRSANCATWSLLQIPDCGQAVDDENLFIAVKTCAKFHKDRVPIVKRTWGKTSKHIAYFSEEEDPEIPTIDLGLPNTKSGHCGKTMAIINRSSKTTSDLHKPWLLIADDDTIISLPRLRRLLACYDPTEKIVLGEKYGYMTASGQGYSYVTGGGGMIFSQTAVEELSKHCHCPAIDSPDDMTIGVCLRRLSIPIIHSSLFHQARPDDYSDGYLSYQQPISFHKHWMVNPEEVYQDWLVDKEDMPVKEEL